jgi:hypothetical protein
VNKSRQKTYESWGVDAKQLDDKFLHEMFLIVKRQENSDKFWVCFEDVLNLFCMIDTLKSELEEKNKEGGAND